MPKQPESVLLVDGHSLIFRAFHALPPLSVDGLYTNAVQGFFSMLFKAMAEYRPQALCVMFDLHAPTFRHTMFADYKAGRKPTPEELRPQVPVIREILEAMQVTQCAIEGYEADDLLGTAARQANAQGIRAYILTGDRDSLQLVGGETRVILTRKGITDSLLLTPDKVVETYGYGPAQVTDMKGLMGDSSDNIPGVPGVGEKTALKLITQYGTLEGVLEHGQEIPGKLGERIRENRELALLSKDLGTIRVTAPLKVDFTDCGLDTLIQALPVLRKYQLHRLSQQLMNLLQTLHLPTAAQQVAADAPNEPTETTPSEAPAPVEPVAAAQPTAPQPAKAEVPQAEAAFREPQPPIALESEADVAALARALCALHAPVALCQSESAVGLCAPDGRCWYAPIAYGMTRPGLAVDQILTALTPLLAEAPLLVHGAKALWRQLDALHLPQAAVRTDTQLAAYLLEPTRKSFTLRDVLAAAQSPAETEAPEPDSAEAPARGRKPVPPPEPPEQAALDAAALYLLADRQRAKLAQQGMLALLTDMEQPLSRVLLHMEQVGFSVDRTALQELGALFAGQIEQDRAQVIALTGGQPFNVNSPKQLGEVLFDRLHLPSPVKKSKAGAWSTSADVLEALDHPAIEPLLHFRKLSKLTGTYIEGLTRLVDATGRIHTTFEQTSTVTGRISSVEPNLQNIPVRSEEGREIRRAFVAREGCVLLDADYSQIELRVLAHLSGDPAMQDAFLRGQDIHTRTAAEVNGVPFESVTPAMRRSAKAVNFGIVYGISGFGLARNIGVTRKEAETFIARYFERYPGVKAFMDASVRRGYELGYAETLFHRRRDLPELRSANRNTRNFGERAAMNTPVQGTAADIIKLAMVRVEQNLTQGGYGARLILQVHDELVVECPTAEIEAVSTLLQEAMERIVTLAVPLVAEVSSGHSWYDAK
ncbi:MAG: DNA polymerase I [Candidatus Limiplasma sp.]|nr:DNA polymerase I [Candidatus Limiplasma sp.]